MSWTSIEDLLKQVERRWKSGEILRSLVMETGLFPLQLRFSAPSSRELAADYECVNEWLSALRSLHELQIEWTEVNSRLAGRKKLPDEIRINSARDAIALLRKGSHADSFLQLHFETSRTIGEILPWVEANPLRSISLMQFWPLLLQVAVWRKFNPVPEAKFVREVDLPGIDTKFIEQNAGVLSEWFELVASPETMRNSPDFRTRHGFLREPVRVRFRILDESIGFAGLLGTPDVELDEDSFSILALPVQRIFVTENKTNYLTFPKTEKSIVVFGAGYGMRALGRASWMRTLPLYYWGDIDSHGFAILSQIREVFPQAKSFLMDEATFVGHKESWTSEDVRTRHTPGNLSAEERRIFDNFFEHGVWVNLRLEQEKIPLREVEAAVRELLNSEL